MVDNLRDCVATQHERCRPLGCLSVCVCVCVCVSVCACVCACVSVCVYVGDEPCPSMESGGLKRWRPDRPPRWGSLEQRVLSLSQLLLHVFLSSSGVRPRRLHAAV